MALLLVAAALAGVTVLAVIDAGDTDLSLAEALLLGAIEGITEYLPVSSTGPKADPVPRIDGVVVTACGGGPSDHSLVAASTSWATALGLEHTIIAPPVRYPSSGSTYPGCDPGSESGGDPWRPCRTIARMNEHPDNTPHAHTPRPPLLVTIPQAAELLAVSRSTVYQLIWDDELAPIRIGRSVRLTIDDLQGYVQRKRAA